MLVEFSKASWIERARQQPDKVRMVLDKIKTDGIVPAVDAVLRKLDQPIPMGYCNAGEVVELGRGVSAFVIGDRVASNGKHAEFVAVPVNLCARIPDQVGDEAAAFTVVGAVALQGTRLAKPTLGECFAVIGLGLVGLLTVQLLRAQGCRVLGLDVDSSKLELARRLGAEAIDISGGEDPVSAAAHFSRGRGVDATIITASTRSSEPVHQAALMCRKRGRIVLVGVTGLELSRADFFDKELSFQVSCSYGPGRYDPEYEEKGHDYPVGYVRWTEQRNFEAVLDMMADGRLDPLPLISHRFSIDDADKAYELIGSNTPSLAVVLSYPVRPEGRGADQLAATKMRVSRHSRSGPVTLGFIGAGSHAGGMLIPAFRECGARLKSVASSGGISGTHLARKHGIEFSTTDGDEILADAEIDAVVVSTRHSSHASWVCDAIASGKDIFVEKPLAMSLAELDAIEQARQSRAATGGKIPIVMVGFNRRFAPQVRRVNELLKQVSGPRTFVMTVNAGSIPDTHWAQDPDVGGGRVIGEACHFIDLLRFLASSPIVSLRASAIRTGAEGTKIPDTVTILLEFGNGSLGTIHYFANGHKSFPKERLEVFVQGRVLQLDNFRKLAGFGWPGFKGMNLWRQDKGGKSCVAAFLHAIESGGASPIPFEELVEVSRATVEASEALAR